MILGLEIGPIVVGVAGPVIAALVVRVIQARSKLLYFFPGQLSFPLNMQDGSILNIETAIVTVHNVGGKLARNVEVTFSHHVFHDQIRLDPAMRNEIQDRNGQMVILLPTLGAGEHAAIQLIHLGEGFPEVLNVRSEEGPATSVPVQLQRIFSPWIIRASLLLGAVGFGFILWTLTSAGIYAFRYFTGT